MSCLARVLPYKSWGKEHSTYVREGNHSKYIHSEHPTTQLLTDLSIVGAIPAGR
jgi:hypothetical protein